MVCDKCGLEQDVSPWHELTEICLLRQILNEIKGLRKELVYGLD